MPPPDSEIFDSDKELSDWPFKFETVKLRNNKLSNLLEVFLSLFRGVSGESWLIENERMTMAPTSGTRNTMHA
jgi:hypothetical protein